MNDPFFASPTPTTTTSAIDAGNFGIPVAGTVSPSVTMIIVAHRLSTVEIADRVLVVHDGEIVEDGSPADLIAGGGRFATLHGAWQDSLV